MTSKDRLGRNSALFASPLVRNSITASPRRDKDKIVGPKALCVSTCGANPTPRGYSFTVTWSHRIALSYPGVSVGNRRNTRITNSGIASTATFASLVP